MLPPPTNPEIKKWEAFIFCPEGLRSQDLNQPVLQNIQSWFIDLQTGLVFPYPPNPKEKTMDWLLTYVNLNNQSLPRNSESSWENENLDTPQSKKFTPYVTSILIALNIIVFILMILAGDSPVQRIQVLFGENQRILVLFGAKVNDLILQGQLWRLFTSMFIHIGFFHLAFNLYALWVLGTFCEERFGHRRFLLLYLISGLGGSLFSFLFTDALSAGASGAIFGLLGALIPYAWKQPRLWKSGLGKNLIVIIVINLGLGILQPQIDIYAHLGGLLFGLIIGFLFP
ncbi:rhomboid family intramembrane serine protease [Desulfitobacterium sp.]|uniref:rhomboid family intramembrane serine protease n=1 Tax=Desulfitobacterium sp. TaxID=49981 RepID=UPI002C44188B|nr:rhomboid family intramembrane serine protease [Desulfitobacterium sp.]HVJ48622.1 rhomboid family intramembrane serine protease [Desulfitobacterium sp.]